MKSNQYPVVPYYVPMILALIACSLFQPSLPQEPSLSTNPPLIPTETVETPTILKFDTSTAQQDPPEDILKEVGYFGGGGPGEGYCPTMWDEIPYAQPTITMDPVDSELMELNIMVICGLQEQESLTTTITYPDGRIIKQSLMSQLLQGEHARDYYAVLQLKTSWDDPVGLYTFSMTGDNISFQSNALIYRPVGPHLRRLNEDRLFLYGFAPNENVTLFYYKNQRNDGYLQLLGLQTYSMGKDGTGLIKVPYHELPKGFDDYPVEEDYIVVGSSSGEHHMLLDDRFGGSFVWSDSSIQGEDKFLESPLPLADYLPCPPEILAKYQAYQFGPVLIESPAGLYLFANPRTDARVIQTLPKGTQLNVADAYCSNGYVWWSVYFGMKASYVIGSDGQQDYLKPAQ